MSYIPIYKFERIHLLSYFGYPISALFVLISLIILVFFIQGAQQIMTNKVALNQFMDQEVLPLMLRPFVCSGHPVDCKVVVIGYNPATSKVEFSKYWNNETGFNKQGFETDYLKTRGRFKGTRLRLNKLSEFLSGKCVLETNVYWTPSKTPNGLDRKDRNSSHLINFMQFLKPCTVIIHGLHAKKSLKSKVS